MDQHILDGQSPAPDFSFAFNNRYFSDRMLQIHILPDENGDGSYMTTECSNKSVRVESLHVSSVILAEKSAFFHKLFSNGTRESEERNITLRICCSEEIAFKDILQYMYSGTLRACLPKELLDMLIVADKFEVTSCVDWCCSALEHSPISMETLLLCIDLPSPLLTNESVESLVYMAKLHLVQQFADIEKFEEHLSILPLSAIEVLLSSSELRVESEDALFDFVIKWARIHYTSIEERREVLSNRLCQLIRFPNMTHHKLNDIVSCKDLDSVCALRAVLEAFRLKEQPPYKRCNERYYTHLPVTVVEFDTPIRECTVFWNIEKAQQMPLYSQQFRFGGAKFQFRCDPIEPPIGFELWIGVIDHDDEERLDSDIEAELSIRKLPLCDFRRCTGNNWPLRHLTLERVYLPVFFDILDSDDIMHFWLRLTLRKVFS